MDINLYNYRINITTAGPSPYNNVRSELYFAGCNKAYYGNPCKGCFNSKLWDPHGGTKISIQSIIDRLEELGSVKAITIVGGEPTDQLDGLIELCKELKKNGYHIIVITWKDLEAMLTRSSISYKYEALAEYTDIIVDGVYDAKQRIYDDDHINPLYSFIGSSNQRIYNTLSKTWLTLTKNVKSAFINPEGELTFVYQN